MPRGRLNDKLQSSYFWALDATAELSVPVFTPLFGFSRITAPEIIAETETFKDGTYLYPRHTLKGGSVGSVTFERGASMFDSDFYSWINFAVQGDKDFEAGGTLGKIGGAIANFAGLGGRTTPRRNLLVIQFARINLSPEHYNTSTGKDEDGIGIGDVIFAQAVSIGGGLIGSAAGSVGAGGAVGLALAGLALGEIGPFEFANRLPARAWLLHACLPVRYRPASDFDAFSGEVSMQELEVQPEYVEEFSLGLKP